jgi:hypothetical protein
VDGDRKEHGMTETTKPEDKMTVLLDAAEVRDSFRRLGETVYAALVALDTDRRAMADIIEKLVPGSQVVRRDDGPWYVIT